jgi:GlpG protein
MNAVADPGDGRRAAEKPMRQLATLPTEDQARAFADYLLTLRVETRLDPEPGGWAVWVCDEDRVAQARAELEQFTRNPADPRYSRAGREAEALRREEDQAERSYARRQVAIRDRFDDAASPRFHPLTFLLIAVSVAVALLTKGGENHASPVFQALLIAPYHVNGNWIFWDGLEHVRQGEVWRLVTPMFLHFGIAHLAMNLLFLHWNGGQVEARRGPWRYALLVLVFAALSNLGQYYLGRPEWTSGLVPVFRPNPAFGGMSGVNYGLFGYAWMKARFEPRLGLVMPPSTALIMVAWFFFGFTGLLSIANMAHAVGFALGLLIGVAPHLWRSLRRRA